MRIYKRVDLNSSASFNKHINIKLIMDDRRPRQQYRPSPKIYISNLSIDTTQGDLRKSFSDFGTIVDVTLKSKSNGIVFAFVEFDSSDSAQKAVQGMNQQQLLGKELKVEFAKGDRGDRGDRGGYRDRGNSRSGYRDRGDRDFDRKRDDRGGDRPKGCFNCNEIGHFARDCPKPRQPRQFNRDNKPRDRDHGRRDRDRDYKRDRHRRRDSDSKSRDSRSRSRSNDKKRKYRKRSSSGSSHS